MIISGIANNFLLQCHVSVGTAERAAAAAKSAMLQPTNAKTRRGAEWQDSQHLTDWSYKIFHR